MLAPFFGSRRSGLVVIMAFVFLVAAGSVQRFVRSQQSSDDAIDTHENAVRRGDSPKEESDGTSTTGVLILRNETLGTTLNASDIASSTPNNNEKADIKASSSLFTIHSNKTLFGEAEAPAASKADNSTQIHDVGSADRTRTGKSTLEATTRNKTVFMTSSTKEIASKEYMYNPAANSTFQLASRKALLDDAPNSTCNCVYPNVTLGRCCTRNLRCTHKMGYILTADLFNEGGFGFGRRILRHGHGFRKVENTSTLIDRDYRDVVLVRNIYSAIVSGYLYHKSGKECWLDAMGTPTGKETDRMRGKWDTAYSDPSYQPNPPSLGRDICQYLADEDEAAGLRAYMEWAFFVHYRGLVNQWRISQSSPYIHRGRTMFVCLQHLTDPAYDAATLSGILKWFFPGGDAPTTEARTASEAPYEGPHATTHNVTLRSRLKDTIKQIDRDQFNGEVAFFNSILPC